MTPPDESCVAQGVILDRLNEIVADLKETRKHIDNKVDTISSRFDNLDDRYVLKVLYETETTHLTNRIIDLETDRKKLIYAVLAAVGVAILGLVIDARHAGASLGSQGWIHLSRYLGNLL